MMNLARHARLVSSLGLIGLVGFLISCQASVQPTPPATLGVPTLATPATLTPTSPPMNVSLAPADAITPQLVLPTVAPAVPVPTVTLTPQPTQIVPTPTRAPDPSLFDALMTPFANEAKRRRAELAKSDPDYYKRVDRDLNEGRINFLLFGYGESHEPPSTEKAIIGSHTIVSYDLRTQTADLLSFTHDIRGPEIERELAKRGFKSPAVRIDQAYNVGGFKLMRQTLEDMTGLAIDFQITFRDVVLQDLIDGVFNGMDINVPEAFDVHPFYLDGKKYDKGHFNQGLQKLNGRQVIQFIKTVPIAEGAYDKSLEHNARKALVFNALLNSLSGKYKDRAFWLHMTTFVTSELINGSIVYDFDPIPLMVNNIGSTTASLQKSLATNAGSEMRMPKIDQSKYIVDPAHGDGGVQWVNANAAVNPVTKKDIDAGVYTSLDLEVPINANPYGDLVSDYWTSVRVLTKRTLQTTPAGTTLTAQ